MSVTVTGLNETVTMLDDLGREAPDRLGDALSDEGLPTVAAKVTPKDTGKLRRSWRFREGRGRVVGAVINPVRYAGHQAGLMARVRRAIIKEITASKGTIARKVAHG